MYPYRSAVSPSKSFAPRTISFFGQYGDDRVTEVGRYLDAALEAVLRNATE
jgi:hypothetical protein